jgi:hypothetical protein
MAELFFDESGFTGEALLDQDQPFFVIASKGTKRQAEYFWRFFPTTEEENLSSEISGAAEDTAKDSWKFAMLLAGCMKSCSSGK